MASERVRHPALRVGLAALALLLAAASAATAVLTHGVVRLDIAVIATLLREVRSIPLRLACVAVAVGSAYAVGGFDRDTTVAVGLGLLEAAAVAAVLSWTPVRAGEGAAPGHRFAVVSVWLGLVVVLGGVLEAWLLPSASQWTTFAEMFFARGLPIGVAGFLAGALASRPSLVPGTRAMLSTLAGPFVVVVLVLLGARIVLAYWDADDAATLQTAADTAGASFQQAVGADIDAFIARSATAPTTDWAQEENFAQSMQPFLGGNNSVSAVALLSSTSSGPVALHVISRQGSSPDLAATMGGSTADAGPVGETLSTGSLHLLGVRDVPGSNADPVPTLVFVTPQTLDPMPSDPPLFSMAVSIPVAFEEASAGLGPLHNEVALVLDQVVLGQQDATLATMVPPEVVFDPQAERAYSEATFGTVTLRIEALATSALGPSLLVRSMVLLGLGGFGIVALLLVLQASNARYRGQRQLEDREGLLAAALASSPGLVALVDAAGVVRMSNGGGRSAPLDDVGQPVADVLPFTLSDEDRTRFDALLEACADGTGGSSEHVDMTSEESVRIYLVNAAPVRASARGGVRTLVQVQDVTEQRARAVRGAQAQRLQALGTMAGGLAHDFNNLLFIITGYLQMLQEDERVLAEPDLVRYVDRAVDAAGRGTEIASSLLAVSRAQPLQASQVDLGPFLRDMLPLVRQAVGQQRTVTLDVRPGSHDVLVDSGQLSSAILNLAINSRDATDPGGTVAVVVDRRLVDGAGLDLPPGEYVVVEVQDDGSGMTPEVGARAFEPFFSTKSTGNGTGLGLTAVYSFATQSGGVATITTEPGRGTTVTMLLPFSPVPDPGAADASGASDPDSSVADEEDGVRRVLVVDDESSLAGLLAAWVEESGCAVRVCTSPHEAIVLSASWHPDVLISDIRLGDPELDGVELAAQLVEDHPQLAVVLMTGYSDRMQEALTIGTRVLAKPFTKDELLRVLEATPQLAGGEAPR